MTKRKGYIYERMEDWNFLVQAERISVKGKARNKGVRMHRESWMQNRIEIFDNVLCRRMKTSEYKHDQKVSGQGKLRDIAKLYFHPSHIQHQMLVMAPYEELDKSLITHTYASRIGYGQHKGAMQLNEWVQEHYKEYPIYVQFDLTKYYDSIPHILIRQELERRIKDKVFIDAMMEPIKVFAPNGKAIPLGIRPSQTFGNLALSSLDRYIKEEKRVKYYIRYLDDFVCLCRNKGEAHRLVRDITKFVEGLGFRLHEPKIRPLTEGIDFLGYVCYPVKGMFWRTSDKKAWLRRRAGVTNPRRLREIDGSAWGYVSHGNRHCKMLYKKMGGVSFHSMGLQRPSQHDGNGRRIIDAQMINMQSVLGRPVIIKDIVDGVSTSHGDNRMAVLIEFFGQEAKLIINAQPVKAHLKMMMDKGITRHKTVFIDRGGKHYDVDLGQTEVLEVNGRAIEERNGAIVFSDNGEVVQL